MAVTIDRTNYNLLVDDDGSNSLGSPWTKTQIKNVLMDPIDTALALLLPLAGGTLVGDLKFTDATYDIGKSAATRPRDGFFSRNFTAGGILAITGYGAHSISAGGTGDHALAVRNTNAGVAVSTSIYVGNDLSLSRLAIQSYSSTYTTSGPYVANGSAIEQGGAGGLSILASAGAGVIRFYTGGTTLRAQFTSAGNLEMQAGITITTVAANDLIIDTPSGQALLLKVNGVTQVTMSVTQLSVILPGVGLGYAVGAGGAVTQATDKTTGVTLNTPAGAITLANVALAASTSVGFTVTNSRVAATDTVIVSIKSGATVNSYFVFVDTVAAGSFHIHIRNISAGTLTEAFIINFAVIKAATS